FAILVVIRQAVDNFSVEQSSNEIISELGKFENQWDRFIKQMDTLGKRIDDAQKDFETLIGTRRRALERPLDRINAIREQRGLALPEDTGQLDMPELNEALIEATEPIRDDR
ncbi:MAG: DNA recombination protein RmuC, partial [Chloroflexi bacterium]|nr:DNA recombination protein RmuC [Chloroflexota bacterium]